jgi:hypothetical protein
MSNIRLYIIEGHYWHGVERDGRVYLIGYVGRASNGMAVSI